MTKPELSIVMPVYNAGKYVAEAVTSLLNQSFTDFELIVVDDGSTDDSINKVRQFNDDRIKILKNGKNQGIVFSRNRGLSEIRGKYYAPFDADDIAVNEKFEIQIEYLKKHPDFGMVGSNALIIDKSGTPTGKKWKLPASPEQIPPIMIFRNYFVHSSLVIKTSAMPDSGYAAGFDRVEDYILGIRICEKFKTCNLPQYLVKYRIHHENATADYLNKVFMQDEKVYNYILSKLGIGLTPLYLDILCALKDQCRNKPRPALTKVENFLLLILDRNHKTGIYNQECLQKEVMNRWIKYLFKNGLFTLFHSNY